MHCTVQADRVLPVLASFVVKICPVAPGLSLHGVFISGDTALEGAVDVDEVVAEELVVDDEPDVDMGLDNSVDIGEDASTVVLLGLLTGLETQVRSGTFDITCSS